MSDDSFFGFVNVQQSAEQKEKADQAKQANAEQAFAIPLRRTILIPQGDIQFVPVVKGKDSPIIPEGVQVRRLDQEGSLTAKEKKANKRGRPASAKVKQAPKVQGHEAKPDQESKPEAIGFREARVLSVDLPEKEQIRYHGFPKVTEYAGTCFYPNKLMAAHAVHVGENRESANLPKVSHSEHIPSAPKYDGRAVAFGQARKVKANRIDIREEGIRESKLSEKDKRRIVDPSPNTWYFFDEEKNPILDVIILSDRAPKGIDLHRYRTAEVLRLIGDGEVGFAIYVQKDGETQILFAPKIGKLIQVGRSGMIAPTSTTVSFEGKKEKNAKDRYQVLVTWAEGIADTADKHGEAERMVRDSWFPSLNQARTYAQGVLKNDPGVIRVSLLGDALPEHEAELEGWEVSIGEAVLTRDGLLKLEKMPKRDEPVPSRNRDKWYNRVFKHEKIWMKAKGDHFHFSGG